MTTEPANAKLIKGATGDWEVIVGLEVHAQVTSRAKLFSGASTAFGGEPNSHVSLVDAAMPGMLPVINRECVAQAVRTGLGLKAKINHRSVFDRKNYFYPDLPQGYQISQYKSPIVGEGEIQVDLTPEHSIKVGIERLHLEQDAGKSLHDQSPTMSFVDLNRSGVALMEIVSKPDMRSADEAKAYVSKLRTILRYIGSCDGDMEKGNLRADVNVSVRRPGASRSARAAKSRTSIRSASLVRRSRRRRAGRSRSSKTAERSIRRRGCSIRRAARRARCAPRRRRTTTGIFPTPICCRSSSIRTTSTRSPPICPSCPTPRRRASWPITASPPMTPRSLSPNGRRRTFFESAVNHGGAKRDAKAVANWLMGDLSAHANAQGVPVAEAGLSAASLATLVDLIGEGVISGKIAKDLLVMLLGDDRGAEPRALVEARGLRQVTDAGAIDSAVDAVIAANPDKAEQAKAKPGMLGWFVGQVMKSTGGKANPQAVSDALKRRLGI